MGRGIKREKKPAPTQEPGTVIQSSNNSKKIEINPKKVGGPESLYSLGRGRLAPPLDIAIGLKCMFIAQFFMANSKKKN